MRARVSETASTVSEVGGRVVDQRLDKLQQFTPGPVVSRGDSRFDQHLELPVAPARFVILLRAFQRLADFAESSVRTEPQVDPITHALRRVGGEHIGHPVGSRLKKLAGHRGLPGIDEHEVDVGAVIELAAAEFAERDDGERRFFSCPGNSARTARQVAFRAAFRIASARFERSSVVSETSAKRRASRRTIRSNCRRRKRARSTGWGTPSTGNDFASSSSYSSARRPR